MLPKVDVFHLLIIGRDVELSGLPLLQLPPSNPAVEVISMKRLTILMILLSIAMTTTGCRRGICGRRLRGARCRGYTPPVYAPPPVQYGYPACPPCPPCAPAPAQTTYSAPFCCCETQCPPSGYSQPYSDGGINREAPSSGQWQQVPDQGSQTRFQPQGMPGEMFSHVVGDRILKPGEKLPGATATPIPPKVN